MKRSLNGNAVAGRRQWKNHHIGKRKRVFKRIASRGKADASFIGIKAEQGAFMAFFGKNGGGMDKTPVAADKGDFQEFFCHNSAVSHSPPFFDA